MSAPAKPGAQEMSVAEKRGGAFLALLLAPLSVAMWACTVARLWAWYVLPTFHGAPAISVPVAAGLLTLISCFQPTRRDLPDGTALVVHVITYGLFMPAFTLLTGWIIKAVFL